MNLRLWWSSFRCALWISEFLKTHPRKIKNAHTNSRPKKYTKKWIFDLFFQLLLYQKGVEISFPTTNYISNSETKSLSECRNHLHHYNQKVGEIYNETFKRSSVIKTRMLFISAFCSKIFDGVVKGI